MNWKMVDTDLLADAASNGIPEAAAELARREQAQHTPGPWRYTEARIMGSKGWVVRQTKTDDDICLVHPSHEGTEANAALIARAPELAAENERLRALVIATATGIREVAGLLAPTAPATAASLRHRADAAIEAAKEATK